MTTEKKITEFFESIREKKAGEPFFTMKAYRSSFGIIGVEADCSNIKDGYEHLQIVLALQQLSAQLTGDLVKVESDERAKSPVSINDEPAGNG